jgi:hypothetical protein
MRHRNESTSPTPPSLDNVFSPAYLARLRERDEVLTAGEAEYAGPWKCEAVPNRPGAIALLRAWESLERGDEPEAIVWHEETALLLAAILPLVAREALFHLSEEEEVDGFPITAVYGEQGAQVAGWLRRFEPEIVGALHLAEALVRNPQALAGLLQAAGGGATEQVGCILARGAME